MEQFVYQAPKQTLRNRIQFIEMEVAEGRYAGQKVGSCGDALGGVAGLIRKVAAQNRSLGYHKVDVVIHFDTAWEFNTRFDVKHASTVEDLLAQIDTEGYYYTGHVPAHMSKELYNSFVEYMNPDKIQGFLDLFANPQFNS